MRRGARLGDEGEAETLAYAAADITTRMAEEHARSAVHVFSFLTTCFATSLAYDVIDDPGTSKGPLAYVVFACGLLAVASYGAMLAASRVRAEF